MYDSYRLYKWYKTMYSSLNYKSQTLKKWAVCVISFVRKIEENWSIGA